MPGEILCSVLPVYVFDNGLVAIYNELAYPPNKLPSPLLPLEIFPISWSSTETRRMKASGRDIGTNAAPGDRGSNIRDSI
jgi:hypothetical protein